MGIILKHLGNFCDKCESTSCSQKAESLEDFFYFFASLPPKSTITVAIPYLKQETRRWQTMGLAEVKTCYGMASKADHSAQVWLIYFSSLQAVWRIVQTLKYWATGRLKTLPVMFIKHQSCYYFFLTLTDANLCPKEIHSFCTRTSKPTTVL